MLRATTQGMEDTGGLEVIFLSDLYRVVVKARVTRMLW